MSLYHVLGIWFGLNIQFYSSRERWETTMHKTKLTISEVIPLKKQKQNPIIGMCWHCYSRNFRFDCIQFYSIYSILLAHYQNGELSDEFARNLDACVATDMKSDKKSDVLVTVSNENAYDGYISRDFPTDLRRKFIAIRKKDSSEVIGQ